MKSVRTIVCCCALLLAVGAIAMQNPANTPAPSGPQQAAPSPSQQAPPPSSQQEPPPQGTRSMQPPTIDDQVRALGVELNLTSDQQAKTKTILEDQRTQAMNIVNDSSLERQNKIEKLEALRETTIGKVRALLDDTQKKKLDQMLQEDQGAQPPPRSQQPSPTPK